MTSQAALRQNKSQCRAVSVELWTLPSCGTWIFVSSASDYRASNWKKCGRYYPSARLEELNKSKKIFSQDIPFPRRRLELSTSLVLPFDWSAQWGVTSCIFVSIYQSIQRFYFFNFSSLFNLISLLVSFSSFLSFLSFVLFLYLFLFSSFLSFLLSRLHLLFFPPSFPFLSCLILLFLSLPFLPFLSFLLFWCVQEFFKSWPWMSLTANANRSSLDTDRVQVLITTGRGYKNRTSLYIEVSRWLLWFREIMAVQDNGVLRILHRPASQSERRTWHKQQWFPVVQTLRLKQTTDSKIFIVSWIEIAGSSLGTNTLMSTVWHFCTQLHRTELLCKYVFFNVESRVTITLFK